MSIEKMKLVSVIGPLSKFDYVVQNHIVDNEFHLENALSVTRSVKGLYPFDLTNPYTDIVKLGSLLCERFDIKPEYRDFSKMDFTHNSVTAALSELTERAAALDNKKDEFEKTVGEDRQIINQLRHLALINADFDAIGRFTYTESRFGRLPREYYNAFLDHIQKEEFVFFLPTSLEKDYVYGMYMTPRRYAASVEAIFASLHFETINISAKVHGTPNEAIGQMVDEIRASEREIKRINEERKALVEAEKENLLAYYAYARFLFDTFDVRRYAAHTTESFYIIGWVPAKSFDSFFARLSAVENISVTVDDPEEGNEELYPPTKLKNLTVFKPFRSFISIYGLPAYNEIDPTFFLGLTYPLLFGIMFGDVGQGLLLVLGALTLWKIKKWPSALMFAISGVFSVIFGFVYGSFFGNEEVLKHLFGEKYGFHVLGSTNNTNFILLAAVALGIVLLTGSMIINIINGARQKNYTKVFFSQYGLAGIVLYWALIIGILDILQFGKGIMTLPYILLFVVLPVVLIYLAHPLGDLVKGKKNWLPEKKGEFALVGFFELFEVAVSFLSNTVSFIRVGAFALSHAGMMLVVFTISDMVSSSGSIPVIIIGNVFVMALEGLIVAIQVLRLEFYELFNRFYEGSGKPYQVFTIDYSQR